MSNTYGEKIKVTVFGQSHSEAIGVVIDGFPAGIKVDEDKLAAFMSRRAPGQALTTPRKEADEVKFLSGLNENGVTCGAPICAVIYNTNIRSKDYENIRRCPRPSHSDYTSLLKSGEGRDIRGGGQFSGRLTAPLCIAGALCMQYLEALGIKIGAHLYSVGKVKDQEYDATGDEIPTNQPSFPAISEESSQKMAEEIENARAELDSVGAVVECKIVGVQGGLGDPMFDGVENRLAKMMFAIPAVKGFEVGSGFAGCEVRASNNNDPIVLKNGEIKTETNNAGGINGGITNSMPILFKVGIKPTPSIARAQKSVNVYTLEPEVLEIKGRHDPCIGVRAVPVVEACSAIVIADMLSK